MPERARSCRFLFLLSAPPANDTTCPGWRASCRHLDVETVSRMKTDAKHDTLVYRLAQMLIKLNQGEKLDPRALADEFGVNLRTVQRDLNERFAYLPLVKQDGGPLSPRPNLPRQAVHPRRRTLRQPGRRARTVSVPV